MITSLLGFFNPWLYGSGLTGLNDITTDSNPDCGTSEFTAVAGWDPMGPAGLVTFPFSR